MKTRCLFLLVVSLTLGLRLPAADGDKPASPAKPVTNPALQAELLAILESDQGGRAKLDAATRAHGFDSPEVRALWKTINEADAINLPKIEAIIAQHGWVGPEEVGAKASGALFYVIQHSNITTQQKYLPLFREAVKAKKASGSQLAMMEDRVALAEGRRQIYGSQLRQVGSDPRMFVPPLEDPDHVDERRASVGLPPMAEYLKHWNLTWDVEAYKKELPALEAQAAATKPSR